MDAPAWAVLLPRRMPLLPSLYQPASPAAWAFVAQLGIWYLTPSPPDRSTMDSVPSSFTVRTR